MTESISLAESCLDRLNNELAVEGLRLMNYGLVEVKNIQSAIEEGRPFEEVSMNDNLNELYLFLKKNQILKVQKRINRKLTSFRLKTSIEELALRHISHGQFILLIKMCYPNCKIYPITMKGRLYGRVNELFSPDYSPNCFFTLTFTTLPGKTQFNY